MINTCIYCDVETTDTFICSECAKHRDAIWEELLSRHDLTSEAEEVLALAVDMRMVLSRPEKEMK